MNWLSLVHYAYSLLPPHPPPDPHNHHQPHWPNSYADEINLKRILLSGASLKKVCLECDIENVNFFSQSISGSTSNTEGEIPKSRTSGGGLWDLVTSEWDRGSSQTAYSSEGQGKLQLQGWPVCQQWTAGSERRQETDLTNSSPW